MTEAEWDEVQEKMIAAFEFSASERFYESEDREEFARHQEGLNLFAKYYWNLWW